MNEKLGGIALGERKLCYGCMERTEFSGGRCPRCGYYDQAPSDPSDIIPGTQLNHRYIVGIALTANGEGITYLAYDQSIGCKVLLREYMPRNLCARVTGSPVISVIPACLAQYKALMAEFTELHKSLARLRGQIHINTVVDLFAENNTTYVVNEYVESIRFMDYLKQNSGELTWGKFSHMLPPLLTTLSLLHNSGVVHRAISPNTIYVTEKDDLILTDLCTAAVRTANTELACEIYNGYAAPEQYAANMRQGTWTDVYGVCALIYRVLTGSMPPSAISRMENDNLIAPAILNPNIPRHVSNVIMHGVCLDSAQRIQTVTELVTQLFDESGSADAAVPPYYNNEYQNNYEQEANIPYDDNTYADYPEQEYPNYDTGYADDYAYDDYEEEDYADEEKPSVVDRLKVPIIVGIVLLLILLICVFVFAGDRLGNTESSSSINETTSVSATEAATEDTQETATAPAGDSIMPDLLGKNIDNQKTLYATWISFDVEEVYSDEYTTPGQICWQEFNAGDTFDSSRPVKVQVSRGPATVEFPPYQGYGYYSFSEKMDEMGIPYTTLPEENANYSNGSIIRIEATKNGKDVEISEGDKLNLNDKYQFTIYYANNPVPETEPPTEAEPATEAPVQTEPPAVETAAPADGENPTPEA